jgi:transcriptional regulator with XRE-family HTH domain
MTEADLRQILSKNIKSLRSQRSLSQNELAQKAGISIPFLSNIERAVKWPHPATLVKLARALDVEAYTLFKEKVLAQSADAQNVLVQYKKDVSAALHKTVLAAIDNSLEVIGSHYIDDIK